MIAPKWDELTSGTEIKRQYERMRIGFIRYEKLRRLLPMQYRELYNRCFEVGSKFDLEVDKLPE